MKFLRVLTAILWVSQSFSPSWGTLAPLSEEEKKAAPANHVLAYAPPQVPQQDLFATLPSELQKLVVSMLETDVTFRLKITSKAYMPMVKQKTETLDFEFHPFYRRKPSSFKVTPPLFNCFPNLTNLNLSGNLLNDRSVKDICRLTTLRCLNLSHCKLKMLPDEFGDLINLTFLDMSGNDYEERRLPSAVCRLTRLKTLDARACGFKSLHPQLGNLNALEYLDLSGNRSMSHEIHNFLSEVGELTRLKTLNLKNCSLKKLPDELTKLHTLETLILNDNYLKQLPSKFNNLSALTYLDLSNNPFQRQGLASVVCELPRLKYLFLAIDP
ncbi:MAG: hypothetical protein BGO77_06075 [Caedibacter sp. 37-49]|nr:MAG: hypothetical protein BGO77_06075 [Caedibacter sp. 37-49]